MEQIINKAFELLIYDVDMSSVDEDVFKRVYDEICKKECGQNKDCKKCLREYYIRQAKKRGIK